MRRPTSGKRRTSSRRAPQTKRRRRTRVSGINGGILMDAVAIVGGAVGGRVISNLVIKSFGLSATIVNAIEIAGGVYLMSTAKNSTFKYVGAGLIAGGGQLALVNLGVISGARPMSYRIHGTPDLRAINGTPNFKAISGVEIPNLNNYQPGLKTIAGHPDTI